ncbi:MAG: virulence RhuM family protein [Lachnospiraceae bacterium]|nr:virulence RhuM family protein [Lachnospiraceae bacterium]
MGKQDNMEQASSIIIYTTEDGLAKIETTFDGDTVWLSIDQMAELFQRDRSVIGKHVRNIFKEGELQKESVWAKFAYTAAEVIYTRADAEKDFMGLTTFAGKQPTLKEATIAKNYLDEKELRSMGQLVSGYLDFAERQAEREQVMTMQDWAEHLDRILTMSGEQLLIGNGSVSHKQAMDKATVEYRKYKAKTLSDVEQDYLDSIKMLEQKTDDKS